MRKKSHATKVAAAEDRKVLRRRILRVLRESRTYTFGGHPKLRDETADRVAALVRELEATE